MGGFVDQFVDFFIVSSVSVSVSPYCALEVIHFIVSCLSSRRLVCGLILCNRIQGVSSTHMALLHTDSKIHLNSNFAVLETQYRKLGHS